METPAKMQVSTYPKIAHTHINNLSNMQTAKILNPAATDSNTGPWKHARDPEVVDSCKRLKTSEKRWQVPASNYAQACKNPIRKIVDNIKKPTNSEKPLIPLSLGDPTVFGNLQCPDVMIDAVVRNARSLKHNGYVHSAGTEAAREAIATKHSKPECPLTKDDIIVASGCSGALEIAISGLLNPGDNILLPRPGFPLYEVIAEVHQIECRFYNLLPEKEWEADIGHMKSLIDDKTKALLVNNPSNPCGSVYSKQHLLDILQVADTYKVPVIADEIYGDMVYGDHTFHPLASLTRTVPVVSVGGLAKQFLVPGWRCGWIMVHDRNDILKDVRSGYYKLSQLILGASGLIQSVIPDVLTPEPGSKEETSLAEFKKKYYGELEENAKFTLEKLSKIDGLRVVHPQGAMYVMIELDIQRLDLEDDCDFTQKLLNEEAVFVLPGQCFGLRNYFRVVFSGPQEKLEEAYDRIATFFRQHLKA